MQGLLRSQLDPEIFSLVNDSHCKYLAEKGFTFAKALEGITQDQLPSDVFNEVLRLQIPRAFSPGALQSLLFADSHNNASCSSSESHHWVGNPLSKRVDDTTLHQLYG